MVAAMQQHADYANAGFTLAADGNDLVVTFAEGYMDPQMQPTSRLAETKITLVQLQQEVNWMVL